MAATPANRRADFNAAELFLADSRLALTVLSQARYLLLRRMFGVSREQANLLTLVLLVTGAPRVFTTAGRVVRAPMKFSGMDAAIGAYVLRSGAMGMAGPSATEVSPFATLVTIAVIGGLALPTIRRAAHSMRAAEHRLRTLRERQYATARRAMRRGETQ